jgi:hypothetical protein
MIIMMIILITAPMIITHMTILTTMAAAEAGLAGMTEIKKVGRRGSFPGQHLTAVSVSPGAEGKTAPFGRN